ncbi:hypothetical protein, conserved [Eimeria praecox]|uniref:Transmembrane protein n=1 Tax=Eimeria praecox TaxID=51316 RepID=U6H2R7_9EIME|nr:hypothetical protein, conserved [Eimeria praecox]
MQSYRSVNALSMCAAVLALSGGETHAFMVGRRNNFGAVQPMDVRRKNEAASPHSSFSLYDTDERNMQVEPSLFSFEGNREASFVQSSGDDDSDEDSDDEDDKQGEKEKSKSDKSEKHKGEKDSEHAGKESHGEHSSHESEGKEKSEKESEEKAEHKEEAAEHKKESAHPGIPKEEKQEDEEGKKKKKKKKEEPSKPENLLTSPQEQSKFIMSSMRKATDKSYSAMEKLVKVMDYLHGVVALLNQIIQLAPPSPSFSETVMLESAGKKISLKALLDEAGNVRNSVDALFTMLMSAKHSIIGAINRAIPARPPAPAPPSK